MEWGAAADIFITQSTITPVSPALPDLWLRWWLQNRKQKLFKIWQKLLAEGQSSWTKMLALNFLISVREWRAIMKVFLISSDDQWDGSPGERTALPLPDWRRLFGTNLSDERRVEVVTGWVELFSMPSALSSSIDCGIAGWQKPTKTNRILV